MAQTQEYSHQAKLKNVFFFFRKVNKLRTYEIAGYNGNEYIGNTLLYLSLNVKILLSKCHRESQRCTNLYPNLNYFNVSNALSENTLKTSRFYMKYRELVALNFFLNP